MNRADLDRLQRDPTNWRFYFIYFCRQDPRVIVPKRIRGLGWTLNMARPMAIPVLVFLIAVIGRLLQLMSVLKFGGDTRLAIVVMLALGTIAFCYGLANPPAA